MVRAINETKPKTLSKVAIYNGVGHDSWTITYNSLVQGKGISGYNLYEVDLYSWLLQYTLEEQ